MVLTAAVPKAIDEIEALQRKLAQAESENAYLRTRLRVMELAHPRNPFPAPVTAVVCRLPYSLVEIAHEACALGAEGYIVTAVEAEGHWWSGRAAILTAEPAAEVLKPRSPNR